jgi:hypothetical protein
MPELSKLMNKNSKEIKFLHLGDLIHINEKCLSDFLYSL